MSEDSVVRLEQDEAQNVFKLDMINMQEQFYKEEKNFVPITQEQCEKLNIAEGVQMTQKERNIKAREEAKVRNDKEKD